MRWFASYIRDKSGFYYSHVIEADIAGRSPWVSFTLDTTPRAAWGVTTYY